MNGGAGRVGRGSALAALSGLLTAVGHVAGGGTLPDLAIMVVLIPLLAGVFVSLAERGRSALGTIATLAAGQLALHQLLVLLHPFHESGPAALGGAAMLVMHTVVTLATALALRHADQAVTALTAAWRRVLPRPLTVPPDDRPLPTRAVPASDLPARIARALAVACPRRGPPVGC